MPAETALRTEDLRHLLTYARAASVLAFLGLAACSVPSEPTDAHDPYEPLNRATHGLNTGVDRIVLRPVSQVYGTVVPDPLRRGIDNASSNLGAPSDAVNKLLQGSVEDAAGNLFRFLINSTVGVFGFFDPATAIGIEAKETGFSDTLAIWGAEEGAYLVLPFLGPSTERDAAGLVVDALTDPIGAFVDEGDDAVTGAAIATAVNGRFEFTETIDSVLYDSADSYVQMRLFYLESRRFDLGGGQAAAAVTDLYEDIYSDLYE